MNKSSDVQEIRIIFSNNGLNKMIVGENRSISFIGAHMVVDEYKMFSVHYNQYPDNGEYTKNPDVKIVFNSKNNLFSSNTLSSAEREKIIRKVIRAGSDGMYNENHLPPNIEKLNYISSMTKIKFDYPLRGNKDKKNFYLIATEEYEAIQIDSHTIAINFAPKYRGRELNFPVYTGGESPNITGLLSSSRWESDNTPKKTLMEDIRTLARADLTRQPSVRGK